MNSGNYIAQGCRDSFAKVPMDWTQVLCFGEVDAVAAIAPGICLPPGLTKDQVARVAIQWIDTHPARLHERFAVLVRDGLKEVWPCDR